MPLLLACFFCCVRPVPSWSEPAAVPAVIYAEGLPGSSADLNLGQHRPLGYPAFGWLDSWSGAHGVFGPIDGRGRMQVAAVHMLDAGAYADELLVVDGRSEPSIIELREAGWLGGPWTDEVGVHLVLRGPKEGLEYRRLSFGGETERVEQLELLDSRPELVRVTGAFGDSEVSVSVRGQLPTVAPKGPARWDFCISDRYLDCVTKRPPPIVHDVYWVRPNSFTHVARTSLPYWASTWSNVACASDKGALWIGCDGVDCSLHHTYQTGTTFHELAFSAMDYDDVAVSCSGQIFLAVTSGQTISVVTRGGQAAMDPDLAEGCVPQLVQAVGGDEFAAVLFEGCLGQFGLAVFPW